MKWSKDDLSKISETEDPHISPSTGLRHEYGLSSSTMALRSRLQRPEIALVQGWDESKDRMITAADKLHKVRFQPVEGAINYESTKRSS